MFGIFYEWYEGGASAEDDCTQSLNSRSSDGLSERIGDGVVWQGNKLGKKQVCVGL